MLPILTGLLQDRSAELVPSNNPLCRACHLTFHTKMTYDFHVAMSDDTQRQRDGIMSFRPSAIDIVIYHIY